MIKIKVVKKMLKIGGILLVSVWTFLNQFISQDRNSDKYLIKIYAEKGITLITGSKIINGHTLHYVQTGSDSLPSLIFFHGTPGSLDNFRHYLQDTDLMHKYRLIAVDRPGFGYSDFGNPLNLQHQSELICSLFDSLDNKKPVYLIGHSLAGALIIKLAAMQQSKIKGLVILAGSVDPAHEGNNWWRHAITYTPLRLLVPSFLRYSNIELAWLKDGLIKLKNDFPKVICPVYIIHGDKDDHVPVDNAEYAAKMLVNASSIHTTILPGANHFIVWTHFDTIKNQLMSLQNN